MRLNLGCGNDYREGYVNVDFRDDVKTDLKADLSTYPWPFEDGAADEILLLDFLEHFPYRSTPFILLECYRILSPRGRLVIQVPDATHTMRAMAQIGEYLCNRCGNQIHGTDHPRFDTVCSSCGQDVDDISEAAMQRFYGGQDYPGNFHFTCFTDRSLDVKADKVGLIPDVLPEWYDEEHFYRNWTIYKIYKKGELW